MFRLDKVIKPWKESAALNDHINLYGFWNETSFLTKSGDVGTLSSVEPLGLDGFITRRSISSSLEAPDANSGVRFVSQAHPRYSDSVDPQRASEPGSLTSPGARQEIVGGGAGEVSHSMLGTSAPPPVGSSRRSGELVLPRDSPKSNAVSPRSSEYYASTVQEDGAFLDIWEKEQWDSLYRLRLEGDPTKATSALVDICDSPGIMKRAIQNPDVYLRPVCRYDYNPPFQASKIVLKEAGRAERQGHGLKWIIREEPHS